MKLKAQKLQASSSSKAEQKILSIFKILLLLECLYLSVILSDETLEAGRRNTQKIVLLVIVVGI